MMPRKTAAMMATGGISGLMSSGLMAGKETGDDGLTGTETGLTGFGLI